ncbi:unnamed protein product [Lepeophtheirus salmonis]|uniref:(salmon louse) hypothetical protein n=1 Tax=Lepeophtheirus salmonis TaxID=72036 RepID=A0A7R8CH39_LEPSM|nr:unnamed protein product [Lepeophtheirus salmonis]CAF2816057.1 unnamed protein product [Lepeophtheirus salmonis]
MKLLSTASFAYNKRMPSLVKSNNTYIRNPFVELPGPFAEISIRYDTNVVHENIKFQEFVKANLINLGDTKDMKYALQGKGNHNCLQDNTLNMNNTEFRRVVQIMAA